MDYFSLAYTVLGGLGIFFFGMKLMSDGLQAASGDVIRKIISKITANRFLAVGVGLLVTMIIQSSSITTVMTVGLVNAGLMTLKQAIGVIFGSNIGTTITGWIISVKVDKYGLLLIGLGFIPGLFAKSNIIQNLGKILIGVGLVFLGLQTMSHAFVPLRENQGFLDSIAYFGGDHYGAYVASIFVGALLTMIVQSSSAMLGITIALATTGIIDFHTSVALVLGENIGTTITAILASIGANANAKRAARAHALFNTIGVSLVLIILPYYFDLIDWMVPNDPNFLAPDGSKPHIATHIAMGHTMFNLSATILFLPFVDHLAKLVTWLTPEKNEIKEIPHLIVLGDPKEMVPATSLVQAESGIKKMSEIVTRMFEKTKIFIQSEENDPKLFAKILEYERITDNMHKEITVFLCYLMERQLSHSQSEETQAMIKVADELESIADYLERLSLYKQKNTDNKVLTDANRAEFFEFMNEVNNFYHLASTGIFKHDSLNLDEIETISDELQFKADHMRSKHIERVSQGKTNPISAITYSDMVVALRKVRAHSFLMAKASQNLYTDDK
jgi:phosphate:Na+ symporter